MIVQYYHGSWTRDEVMKDQSHTYLFGDNTEDRLITHYVPHYTQAVIRGLPNAIGIDTKKNRFTFENPICIGKMILQYGKKAAPWITSKSTIEAIKKGERTATTRYFEDGHIDYWMRVKIGDIIRFDGWNNEKVFVQVIRPLRLLPLSTTAEEWCKLEGWNEVKFNEKIKDHILRQDAYQIEFRYISDKDPSSYFTDDDFEIFKNQVDSALNLAESIGKPIMLPESGIGTGKAQLQQRAPKLFDYLQRALITLQF